MNAKTRLLAILVALSTLGGGSLFLQVAPAASARHDAKTLTAASHADADDYYETVVSVPVESGTFAHDNSDVAERVTHGPNSISISDEGNFVIGNHVDNTATELNPAGEVVNKVAFGEAAAVVDAVKAGGEFYALDRGADRPILLSSYGYAVATAPSGSLRISSDNEGRFGPALKVTRADGQDVNAAGGAKAVRADGLRVSPGNPFLEDANSLKVWRGKRHVVDWRAEHPIAETRLLGSTAAGDFYVVVFEIVSRHVIALDQKVLRFSREGHLLGLARVPQEQATPIVNDTALSRDGDVFVLMPRATSTDVVRLKFKDSLPPLNFVEGVEVADVGEGEVTPKLRTDIAPRLAAASMPSVTRQQIADVANLFFNSSINIPAASVNGSCRVRPYYLTRAGNYTSVPYSWGGSDTPQDFANKMGRGVLAGHVARTDSTCSTRPAGIDCSGFVALTWGMPGHPFATSTVMRDGYVNTIDWAQLRQGDALNWSGTHILLFVRADNNTVWTWEATGDPGTHKAMAHQRPWSELRSHYSPVRYAKLSITNPTARMTATSDRGVVYENSTAVYTVSPGQSIRFTFDSSRSSANKGVVDSRTWKISNSTVSAAQSFGFNLGRGTHDISLTVTNSDGGSSTSTQKIVINEVQVVPPPRVTNITPSAIKSQTSVWLRVTGSGLVRGLRAQVRTPAGGPWQIATSGVSYVSAGEVWVNVRMGYGSYTATLELVNPNGAVASGRFTVRP